ncbi:MAG: DNRLRE domain-containing protein [Parafilimonas sp.]
MKKNLSLNHHFLLPVFAFIFCLFSCNKESLKTNSLNGNAASNSTADVKQLVLAPGFYEKASASVEKSLLTSATDTTPDFRGDTTLSIYAWTTSGRAVFGRAFIRFAGLSQIPNTSQVVSATLHLTGITDPNRSMPQGDSYYPGSPYPLDNSVVVAGVTENWIAKTLTWNNQPPVTQRGVQIIPASTQQWGYNVDIDVTELVSAMVAHPARNYGFELRCQVEEKYRSMGFYSTQHPDSAKRPTLIVTYN